MMTVEDLHKERFGLYCELTVTTRRLGEDLLLFSGRFNTSNVEDRSRLQKYLEPKIPSAEVDWGAILEQVCAVTRDHFKRGQPFIDLRKVEPQTQPRWLLEPFVASSGISGCFADGGTGKSLFALAACLVVASGREIIGTLHTKPVPVGYLDYEDDEYVHAERLRALCRPLDIEDHRPVYHRSMTAGIVDAVSSLRRDIAELGIGLIVVDSLGMARHGAVEDAEATLRAGAALRALQVPVFVIDHIPKAGPGEKPRPIGSVMSFNMARVLWYAEAKQQDEDSEITLCLTMVKRNKGAKLRPLAYRITYFSDDRQDLTEAITIRPVEYSSIPGFVDKLPASERILFELKRGCLDYDELVESTGLDKRVLSARLSELKRSGKIVYLTDRRSYGLAAEPVAALTR